jgi:hypothetical protein
MKKGLIGLLILILCAWVQFAYGAAGDVASVNGKAITAAASVGGIANASILTFAGKPVSDGDSGDVYTDCSTIGTHAFVWYGDYASDNKDGCTTSETTVDGTLEASTEIVDPTTEDPEVPASPLSGGNCLKLNANSDYIRWPVTANEFSGSEGKACFSVYLSTGAAMITYLGRVGSTSEQILVITSSGNALTFSHEGSDPSNLVTASGTTTLTVSDTTWTTVCVRWSVSNNQLGISNDGGSTWKTVCAEGCDYTDADAVTAFGSGTTYFYFGYYGSVTNTVYIDDLLIDLASGI